MLLLPGQQWAAVEVVGHFRGHAQQDFGGFGGEPDVVLGIDVVGVGGVGGEAAGFVHLQPVDERDAEILEPPVFFAGQIPDADFMDQPVGLNVARLAFVVEAAFVAFLDGGLQRGEGGALPAQVFMRHGLYLGGAVGCRGVQLVQQVAQAGIGEEVLRAGQLGVVVQLPHRDGAAGGMGELPAPLVVAFGDAVQAFAQVALDGADVDLEFFSQLVFVDVAALMQGGKDSGQAPGQLFAFGTGFVLHRGRHDAAMNRFHESDCRLRLRQVVSSCRFFCT